MYPAFPRGMTTPRQSPSVSQNALIYGGQMPFRPRSLLSSFEIHRLPMYPNLEEAVFPATIEEHVEVNQTTNQTQTLGGPDSKTRPPAPVGSKAGNRPKQAYNRFNETEKKEREAIAEDWIQAEVKKRVFTNRRKSAPNPELVNPDTLLLEYAMYTKDHSFINAIRVAVAGMIVGNKTFACCLRGTSKESFLPIQPTSETDDSSQTVQASRMQTAQVMVKGIIRDYLQVSKVSDDMIEQVEERTFSEPNSLFLELVTDVEQKVFSKYEDLPAYDWDPQAKVRILQKDSRFKSSLCSREIELEIIFEHLKSCDRFFWRVHKTLVTASKERMDTKGEEVLTMHQVIQRLRRVEVLQDHALGRLGDINDSLDNHEKELVDIAYNTFTHRKEEADKELILKNMNWAKNSNVQKCVDFANDLLFKNGIKYHTGIYGVSVDRKTCKATFNSERDKKAAEAVLAKLRRNSKGKSTVSTARPDAKPYAGDVRPEFNEIKKTLFAYWQQFCTKNSRPDLIVSEDTWKKNVYVLNRVTGRGKDMKMFFEFTDPSNMESFLDLNPDQNPFEVLDMNKEVPNACYLRAVGSRAKTLNVAGIHTLGK